MSEKSKKPKDEIRYITIKWTVDVNTQEHQLHFPMKTGKPCCIEL